MEIEKYLKNTSLVPDDCYIARIHAVRQKSDGTKTWTVVCLEIAEGFYNSRKVFDIIRRSGAFHPAGIKIDRNREQALVRTGPREREYVRACRAMIGRLVEIEVKSRWREDLKRMVSSVVRYLPTRQF